jgi:hypothetical protein
MFPSYGEIFQRFHSRCGPQSMSFDRKINKNDLNCRINTSHEDYYNDRPDALPPSPPYSATPSRTRPPSPPLYQFPQSNQPVSTYISYKLQKRSVWITCFAGFRAHTIPLFKQLAISSIYDLCSIQILLYVYKSINLLLPNHITNYFTRTICIHSHSTRTQKHNLYINTAHKSCRIYSFACSGPKYWNKLPYFIQSARSLRIFEKALKRHLISGI